MNTRPVVRLFMFLMLVGPSVGAGYLAEAATLPTAKTRLMVAGARAHTWHADAVLVVVETSTAEPDGSAYNWMYVYDSPGSKEQAAIIIDDQGAVSLMPTSTAFHKPLGEFVDSDQAIAAAVAAGMKTNSYGMKMSLKMSGRAEWFMSDLDFSYTIDAVTGKLLTKEE